MNKKKLTFNELPKEIQKKLKKNYNGNIAKLKDSFFTKDGKMILED